IQPYAGVDLGQRLRDILDAATDIPLRCVSFDGDRFDVTNDWAMQFDFEMPHPLEIQACASQSAAIPIAGECVAVKTSARFETRVSGFETRVDATEEGFEGLIDAPQNILCRRKVRQSEMP